MTSKVADGKGTETVTLRLVVPKIMVQRILSSLGPEATVEVEELELKTGGLTTEEVVQYIRKYNKAKEDLLQALRQIDIKRDSKPILPKLGDLDGALREVETRIGEVQTEYERAIAERERIEREALDSEKQVTAIRQIVATGFSYEEITSKVTGFRRILGSVPSKRIEPARKALRVLLKDRIVMTTGARAGDRAYLLIASATDAVSQTLQTLLQYDFVSVEIPSFDGSDYDDALKMSRERVVSLTRQVEAQKTEMASRRHGWAAPMNVLADEVQETLLLLRGSLRLGEATRTAHIYATLEKHLPAEILTPLVKDGVLEID